MYYIFYNVIAMDQSPVNLYVGQVVYEVKNQNKWLMRFLVAQHLDALLKKIFSCSTLTLHFQMLRKM